MKKLLTTLIALTAIAATPAYSYEGWQGSLIVEKDIIGMLYMDGMMEPRISFVIDDARCAGYFSPGKSTFTSAWNINGQKVRMKRRCEADGKGQYIPATYEGLDYIISEFKRSNVVTLNDKTLSAKGFTKAFNSFKESYNGY